MTRTPISRNTGIAAGVLVLHIAALWALQSGLVQRLTEIVVPVQLLSEWIEPPAPKVTPVPPAPAVNEPPPKIRRPVQAPAPQPLAIADPEPAPNAPVGVLTPQPPAPTLAAAPPAPAAYAAPGPARLELPSTSADYLQNPAPPYPPLSKRLGEQGKVLIRVQINAGGTPQQAEIARSSGFERLDQTALNTVLKWRYVPGKRNGVPETMWFNVPINFVLE